MPVWFDEFILIVVPALIAAGTALLVPFIKDRSSNRAKIVEQKDKLKELLGRFEQTAHRINPDEVRPDFQSMVEAVDQLDSSQLPLYIGILSINLAEVEELRAEQKRLEIEIREGQAEKEHLEARLSKKQAEKEQLKAELAQLEAKQEQLEAERRRLEAELTEEQALREQLGQRLSEIQNGGEAGQDSSST